MSVMMGCGHASQAVDGEGNPACVICVGFKDGAVIPAEPPPLAGRQARCTYDKGKGCPTTRHRREVRDSLRDSSIELAFFKYQPGKEYDDYYCGCWGWD